MGSNPTPSAKQGDDFSVEDEGLGALRSQKLKQINELLKEFPRVGRYFPIS